MLQFLFSPVLLHRNLLSTILSVVLYVVALSYYHYLNFLGYSALPFLNRTEVRVADLALFCPFWSNAMLKNANLVSHQADTCLPTMC